MNLNQDLSNIQMVVSTPHILQNWWLNIRGIYWDEILGYLGALLSLLGTRCGKVFVTLLIGFWKSSTMTLKFLYFKIAPTLEEFSNLNKLSIIERLSMIPSAICTCDFLRLLDLHIFRSLRYVMDDRLS